MSPVPRILVMRKAQHTIYTKKSGARCVNCPTEFNIGDSYVPRRWGTRRSKTVIYCVPCAKRLNIV